MNSTPRKWIGYAESHDEERNFFKAKEFGNGVIQSDSIVRIGRVPLNVAFTVLTPGPKMIWQFGEFGYDYSIDSFGGRTNSKPSGFPLLDLAHRRAAYEKSSKAITLKKMFPKAFIEGEYELQIASTDWAKGKRIALTHADLNMVMVGNFEPSASITATPNFQKTGTWYELMTGSELNVTYTGVPITVNAGEVKIFTDRKINIESSDRNVKYNVEFSLYPTITDGKMWVSTTTDVNKMTIYNMQGAVIRTYSNTNEMEVSDLSAGMYFMEISTKDGKGIQKFMRK